MKLSCIRKKREVKFFDQIFQVKTIIKDVRKTIVLSFMFLFNLPKSVILCVKERKYNTISTTEPMK